MTFRPAPPPGILFVVLAVWSATATGAAGAVGAVTPSVTVTAIWNDNLSRSEYYPDERAAATYTVSGSFDRRFPLSRDVALSLGGEARADLCPRYDDLDFLAAGPRLELRRKFGLGPFAPALRFAAAAGGIAARESYRSGWSAAGSLTFSKRLSESWRASMAAEWLHQETRESIYDRHMLGLSGEINWDVTDRWQIGLGACRQNGRLPAYASWGTWAYWYYGAAGPELTNYYQSLRWISSDTFGSGWVAYQIDGRTTLWWITLSPALSANTALPLRYERAEVRGGAGTRYVSNIFSLSLVHRF